MWRTTDVWTRLCRSALCLLAAAAIHRPAPARCEPATLHPGGLTDQLRARLAEPRFARAQWGICIQDAETGQAVFEHNASQRFTPASLTKLFTAALVLDRLGGSNRLKTSLWAEAGPASNGMLHGPLVVEGNGDPGFLWEESRTQPLRSFQPLVDQLRNAGIQELPAGIVGYDALSRWPFPGWGPRFGAGWAWEDLIRGYGAPISGLTANQGRIRLRVRPGAAVGEPCLISLHPSTGGLLISNLTFTEKQGTLPQIQFVRTPGQPVLYVTGTLPIERAPWETDVAALDPALLFLELFKRALEEAGIRVSGPLSVRRGATLPSHSAKPPKLTPLGSVESAPVRELVRDMLKDSRNGHAAILWTLVGLRSPELKPSTIPEAAAARELEKFLTRLGISPEEVHLEEGTGLSRNNLVTPRAVATLLLKMTRHPEGKAFQDGLPVAGVDGTLADRMKGTAAEGRVCAKTGTLRWAHGLAGFAHTKSGHRLVFCFLLNRHAPRPPDPSPQAELDALAELLITATIPSPPSPPAAPLARP